MNTEVEEGCHARVLDKRRADCSRQMRAVIGTVLAFRSTGRRSEGQDMKHRTSGEMKAGAAILQLLLQLKHDLGVSYRLMHRDLHIV
ncbi:hypothetical protein KQ910_00780 [Reyranella sp. MMS21-HV4-11]|uniref:Uncharacterized protein n=1 Tax=Reyranella humidisoli TaxID=2849149 RepID=A0ABS6ICF2_9HYPH|nr:hypothetical protein [Reyranella sp. MMS21-HV4-11]MBU8872272.1 hypothetical protein [Reyranella sp. MMS21-HV4-11]